MEKLRAYIFPISGGEFPNQLALLVQLYYAILELNDGRFPGAKDYAPDLCFGASGGNISAYIGMGADWNAEAIKAICREIEPSMFVLNWWTGPLSFLPSALLGIGNQSLYRPGSGPKALFEKLFPNSEMITRSEILTLAYNDTENTPQVFSNRSEENSFFKPDSFSRENKILYQVDSVTYNDGNIDKISDATVASYSIPLVTQLKDIDGKRYADGGVSYASPFMPLHMILTQDMIDKKLQLTYFCSYNMNDPSINRTSFYGNSLIGKSLQQMLHTSILNDRAAAPQVLRMRGLDLAFEEATNVKIAELALLLKRIQDKNYALFLYPMGAPYIDILNFTTQDILDTINESSQSCGYFLWKET